MEATASGRTGEVRRLLDLGADANQTDREGRSALMIAAGRGDQNLVDLLLAAGADPALTDRQGWSAADHARSAGHEALAFRLTVARPPTSGTR